MRVGVYVGSFDPVHTGHIKIVNYLLNNILDKIVLMPTGAYWDKDDLVDINHRINMLKIYETERILVEDEKNDLPYTYMAMEYLEKKYPEDELYLIIGADNIINFDKWQEYETLLAGNMIIINRSNSDVKKYLKQLNKKAGFIITDDLENIDISSTQIREYIKTKNWGAMQEIVDKCVFEYIIENKLYME